MLCLAYIEQRSHAKNTPTLQQCLPFLQHDPRADTRRTLLREAQAHLTRISTCDTCLQLRGSYKEERVLTVTSSLFVKLPLSVQAPSTKIHLSRHALKGYTTSPTHHIQLSRQEEETVAGTNPRNKKPQNSPQSVCLTPFLFPWSQELFGRFFSFSPFSFQSYILVLLLWGGAPHRLERSIPLMSNKFC